MERFNALQFRPYFASGIRALVEFDNGYMASVIRNLISYGGDRGLYELAVMDENGLTYETPITDDVLGYLTEADVDRVLGDISALPPKTETSNG